MRIIFAGTPANAAEMLRALVNSAHEIVAVLTREDALVGRKRELEASPVAQTAIDLGIPVIKANRVDSNIENLIADTGADLGVVVAYGALLRESTIALLRYGWINLHYSLLPDWRGAAPAQRAILAGDVNTGVTIFQINKGLDTGAIWSQVPTQIEPHENSAELITRLTALGISLLNETLPIIESGVLRPKAQVEVTNLRVANKLTRAEALLNFENSAIEIERSIRAFNPEPVAYTHCEGAVFRVLDARALGKTDWSALDDAQNHSVGDLIFDFRRVLVKCGQGTLLELKMVQPAGKKSMTALAWCRGTKATRLG